MLDYHEGADIYFADGIATHYGDSHWNQILPITVVPKYDARSDFEKSIQAAIDAAVLELTSGSDRATLKADRVPAQARAAVPRVDWSETAKRLWISAKDNPFQRMLCVS